MIFILIASIFSLTLLTFILIELIFILEVLIFITMKLLFILIALTFELKVLKMILTVLILIFFSSFKKFVTFTGIVIWLRNDFGVLVKNSCLEIA